MGARVASVLIILALVGLTVALALALNRDAGQRPGDPPVTGLAAAEESLAERLALPALPSVALGRVERVVDGDTFKVRIGAALYTVRALGIDTPETKHPYKPVEWYGPEASDYAERVLAGRAVRLEADASQAERDCYGRELRYVRLVESGVLYQALALMTGTAREYTHQWPHRYQREFRRLEADARGQRRGQWGPPYPPGGA